MRHRPHVASLLCGALMAATACTPAVSSTGSRTVHTLDPSLVRGPHAPAGQRVSVVLEQSIDTLRSARSAGFTARLEQPLRAADGSAFADSGARIRGHVVSLGTTETPRLRLEFDAIESRYGTVPLHATLLDARYQRYPGPVVFVPTPYYDYGYGSWGRPFGYWPTAPIGGGPVWFETYTPYQRTEIRLPATSRLNLLLTRPVFAPGTVVIR